VKLKCCSLIVGQRILIPVVNHSPFDILVET